MAQKINQSSSKASTLPEALSSKSANQLLSTEAAQLQAVVGSKGKFSKKSKDLIESVEKDAETVVSDQEVAENEVMTDVILAQAAGAVVAGSAAPVAGATVAGLSAGAMVAIGVAVAAVAAAGGSDDTPAVVTTPTTPVTTTPVVAGQSFTLTTGADNFVGGAGNDTFNGSVSATAADNSLTLTDLIDGGAGSNTLNVVASVLAADISVPAAGLRNVQTVNIRALDGDGTVGTNAATFVAAAGVTAVNADRSSSNVTVTDLAVGASVGMIGDGIVKNGILSYAYATATSDQVINISGGTLNTGVAEITATSSIGATKATINSTGAANKVDAVLLVSGGGNSLTSLNVNAATNLTATLTANDFAATAALTVAGAAASVDLGTAFDGKTIDASGMTAGGLTIATNTNLTSFKGGAGNDVVSTTALAAAAVAGAVDAGAGSADMLNVVTATDVDTAAKAGLFTNFEVLRNAGATDLDVSLLSGITSVQLNGANAGATKLTAAQAANIRVLATNATNAISLATASGTSDVLGLTLENATAAAVATAIDVTALTATGFETINVVSSSGVKAGGTGVGNDLAFAAAGDLTKINVSGDYDLTIAAASITKAVTIVSTQAGTAALYVSGDFANASTVTGSGGADAFILGTGFGTYNGGAGNDSFSGTAAQVNTGTDYNVINGGEGTTDTLNITGGALLTLVDNNLRNIAGIEKIVVATTVDNNQTITTGGFFDSGFKASGIDLTTTTAKGTVTIDMTSFTGAAKISATTVGTTGTEGAIDIQTGAGADDITVSAAAAGGAGSIKTFAGNDKITTASAEAFTIAGGAGNDTIVLGSTGINTVDLEATAALNGVDTITSVAIATDLIRWLQGDAETAVAAGAITTSADDLYRLGGLTAGKADSAAEVAAAINAGATWTAATARAWIAISDDNSTAVYQWDDVAGSNGVQVSELTLVATIDAAMTTTEIATAFLIA
jgi:hypothetical protein